MMNVSSSSLDIESDSYSAECELLESFDQFKSMAPFVCSVLQRRLAAAVSCLNVAHSRCLETMIALAHDMKRDVMITPKRISFAREKEVGLLLLGFEVYRYSKKVGIVPFFSELFKKR